MIRSRYTAGLKRIWGSVFSWHRKHMPFGTRKNNSHLWLVTILAYWMLFQLGACATAPNSAKLWHGMSQKAKAQGFTSLSVDTPPFRLSALLKNGAGPDLVVYLEGDGQVLLAGRPTRDPSPRKAQGYELALADPAPTVLYLARIGQFQPYQTGTAFQPYWTNKRLSPESVKAASFAIDQVMSKTGAQRLHLVGYSGGGGLAVLLAEQRKDVVSLVTVAGLLDTDWWVRKYNYQPLTGSMNPADQAELLLRLPQLHFYGETDNRIPPEMSARFAGLASFQQLRRIAVPTDHWERWTALWPQCLQSYVLPFRNDANKKWEANQAIR